VRRTTLRVTVGIDGRARDCVPVVSSGDRSIDARSCTLMAQRARYAPARDRDGHPAEALTILSWVWVPIG
jgi:protein TonB